MGIHLTLNEKRISFFKVEYQRISNGVTVIVVNVTFIGYCIPHNLVLFVKSSKEV